MTLKDRGWFPAPLDLGEDDLIVLFRDAIANDVFTDRFKAELRELL
jgi:hypothetical protein